MPRVAVPRVLIADDHVPTRDVLGDCLRAAGLDIVAEAGTAAEAVDAAVARAPDLCLLDVCMPGTASTQRGTSAVDCRGRRSSC